MSPADEAMARYAQGDPSSFDAVYDGVAPRLERYLRRHQRGGASRVEDIIQQTFLQMHASRGTFIVGAEVFPWALAIARRLMMDVGRRTQREETRDMDDDELAGRELMRVVSSEAVLEARELGACLSTAFEHLSAPQRLAFELVKLEGLTHAQAAMVAGTSVTGMKLRVHRAYVALRAALEEATRSPLTPSPRPPRSRPGGLLPAGGQ